MPENRFGLDCDDVVTEAEIISLYGEPLQPKLSTYFGRIQTETLIQDGALVCRWGEGPFRDGSSQAISIIATERGGVALDELAALSVPIDFPSSPTIQVDAIPDSTWLQCIGYGLAPDETLDCNWAIERGPYWIQIDFSSLPSSEADPARSDPSTSSIALRSDSLSTSIAASIVERIAQAPLAPPVPSQQALPSCDLLFDWSSVASQLGLPLNSVASTERSDTGLRNAVLATLGTTAAERQSVRACEALLGDESGATDPFFIRVIVVPEGQWIGLSGLWSGSSGQVCRPYPGAVICEFSTTVDTTAINVFASKDAAESVTGIVVGAYTP